jgi:hypothetical protein
VFKTNKTMEPPKRKHAIKIQAHADTQLALIEALENIIFDISRDREEGVVLNSLSACSDSGYTWSMEIKPDQTAENYQKEIQEYLTKTTIAI